MFAGRLLRQTVNHTFTACGKAQPFPRIAPRLVITPAPTRHVAAMATIEKVQPQAAAEMVEAGWTYLDVRTPEEFAAGHAPGAVNIPLMLRTPAGMEPNPVFMDEVLKQFDKDTQLLVGCKAGNRSARACSMLQQHYATLADQTGGWDGWTAANLPVKK